MMTGNSLKKQSKVSNIENHIVLKKYNKPINNKDKKGKAGKSMVIFFPLCFFHNLLGHTIETVCFLWVELSLLS